MKSYATMFFIILLSMSLAGMSLHAQAPQLLNYQGKLTSGGAVQNGNFSITFSIYSTTTGVTPLWTETQNLTVTKGVFNVLLGNVTAFPTNLFTGTGDRYLGIKSARIQK